MNDYHFIRDYCSLVGSSHQWLHAELRRARKDGAPDDAWSYEGYPRNRWRTVRSLPEHAPYRRSLERRGLLP